MFGVVYKFVFIEGENGEMMDMIKISVNFEKVSILGLKCVYCIINNLNGKFEGDYIMMEDEDF